MNIRRTVARWKRKLLKKPVLKDPRFPSFWFNQILKDNPAYIVQIGSNDGKTGDPLYPLLQQYPQWRALFVEPVPYAFERLVANYPDTSRFRFENVAVNLGEKLDFYWVDRSAADQIPDLPYWYDQLGSFRRERIVSELNGVLEPFIRSTRVEGISLRELLERNGVDQMDLLHVDAEGYDWVILSQLDLQRYQPTFILFEHHHLAVTDLEAVHQFLGSSYQLFSAGIDTLAVNRSLGVKHLSDMARHLPALKVNL